MEAADSVVVEFYGVPRLLAGRAELSVPLGLLLEVLAAVERACPRLKGLIEKGRLAPQYLLSLNGREFVTDLAREVTVGTRLLLLSADAGG